MVARSRASVRVSMCVSEEGQRHLELGVGTGNYTLLSVEFTEFFLNIFVLQKKAAQCVRQCTISLMLSLAV